MQVQAEGFILLKLRLDLYTTLQTRLIALSEIWKACSLERDFRHALDHESPSLILGSLVQQLQHLRLCLWWGPRSQRPQLPASSGTSASTCEQLGTELLKRLRLAASMRGGRNHKLAWHSIASCSRRLKLHSTSHKSTPAVKPSWWNDQGAPCIRLPTEPPAARR